MMNPYQRYLEATALTAAPLDLVLMLYHGVQQSTALAIQAVERNDVDGAHDNLVRAEDIVLELAASLNREDGGQMAETLLALYEYSYRRLVDANVRKEAAPAVEVAQIFRGLLTAWQAGAEAEWQESAAARERVAVAV